MVLCSPGGPGPERHSPYAKRHYARQHHDAQQHRTQRERLREDRRLHAAAPAGRSSLSAARLVLMSPQPADGSSRTAKLAGLGTQRYSKRKNVLLPNTFWISVIIFWIPL